MDVYEIITEQIIAKLESGVIPWRKPWRNYAGGLPRNGVSKHEYRGINLLLASLKDYDSPDFFTARQIEALGGKIKKGEKGNLITFWKMMKFRDPNGEPDPDTGDCVKSVPLLRYYQVWNRTQCEGLPAPKDEPQRPETQLSPIEAAEALINGYADRPRIREGEARAYYTPHGDFVNMPKRSSFSAPEEWYSTLFHELTHSTGHTARIGRLAKCRYYLDDDRSREELCAEMGASFLCGMAGIEPATLDNSAAYISSWLQVLKGDKKFLVEAAGAAQKAVDYMLGKRGDESGETAEPKTPAKPMKAKEMPKPVCIPAAEQLCFGF